MSTIRRLGKRPAEIDARTFQFRNYREGLAPILPPHPNEVSWVVDVPNWGGPMLNDSLGSCVPATAGHAIVQWSFFANAPGVIPSDNDILKAYEDVGGYNPADPNSDNGCVMIDMMNYWRQTGVGGHKIDAYVAVDPRNIDEIMEAIYLFGSVQLGLGLPVSVMDESSWTVPDGGTHHPNGEPWGWGGHAVPVVAASPQTLTCITWGQRLKMSHNFLLDYADEAYAAISSLDWLRVSNRLSPLNFNIDQLMADLKAL